MIEDAISALPLFASEPPLELTALEVALGLGSYASTIEGVFVRIDAPSPEIETILVELDTTPSSIEACRNRPFVSCRVWFASGRTAARARLSTRYEPLRVHNRHHNPYDRFGAYVTDTVETDGRWSLFWYHELPEWARSGFDPATRATGVTELGRYLRDLAAMPDLVERAAMRVTSTNPLKIDFTPPARAQEIATWLDLGAVAGTPDPCKLVQVFPVDDELVIVQPPQVGSYTLTAAVDGGRLGRSVTDDGIAEIAPISQIAGLTFSFEQPRRAVAKRAVLRFTTGQQADDIVELGRNCFTGRHLPNPLFAAQAVSFCWHEYTPTEMWSYLRSLARMMSDRELYSIAPPAWHDHGVGVFRISVSATHGDYQAFLAERTKHGVPQIEWLFGESRGWGVVFDREANVIVSGVVRANYKFEGLELGTATRLHFDDVIARVTANMAEPERDRVAQQLRTNYSAGS